MTTPNKPNLTYTNIQPRSDNLQPTDMEHCVCMYVYIYALSWPHGRSTHIVADTAQFQHVAKLQAIFINCKQYIAKFDNVDGYCLLATYVWKHPTKYVATALGCICGSVTFPTTYGLCKTRSEIR